MTTSLAFCANTSVCLIDLPRTEPIDDPQSSLQAAVHWALRPRHQIAVLAQPGEDARLYLAGRGDGRANSSNTTATSTPTAKTCPKSATEPGTSQRIASAAPTRANMVGAPSVTNLVTIANALIVAVCIVAAVSRCGNRLLKVLRHVLRRRGF
jgi:hypothetical protein